jgi:hypothetical protein
MIGWIASGWTVLRDSRGAWASVQTAALPKPVEWMTTPKSLADYVNALPNWKRGGGLAVHGFRSEAEAKEWARGKDRAA